jgi:hypothetical protein
MQFLKLADSEGKLFTDVSVEVRAVKRNYSVTRAHFRIALDAN